jgi:uncharacterized protein YidB (DUF937 family)
MGLLDILNGMQNGPQGQAQPGSSGSKGGGMSPMTMALIGLLAYKAMKSLGGTEANPGTHAAPAPTPAGSTGGGLGDILGGLLGGGAASGQSSPGNLNDLLRGGLGGLLGGGNAGNVLSSGLGNIIKDLQTSGQGDAAKSWVGTGENEDIAPGDLAHALGADTINSLARQTGMSRDDLLAGLSQQLPGLIDRLTPHGRLPTADEAGRMI